MSSPRIATEAARLPPDQERELAPLPVAVDIRKPDLSKPDQLRVDIQELVRRILFFGFRPHGVEKASVAVLRCRSHVFKVAEHAPDRKRSPDFPIKSTFPLVVHMVDRKTRHDDVEDTQWWQGILKVVLHDFHAFVRVEAALQSLEHRKRKINRHTRRRWTGPQDQVEKPSIAGAEIKNALNRLRQFLEQGSLAGSSMWNTIGSLEVAQDALGGLPFTHNFRFSESSSQSPAG